MPVLADVVRGVVGNGCECVTTGAMELVLAAPDVEAPADGTTAAVVPGADEGTALVVAATDAVLDVIVALGERVPVVGEPKSGPVAADVPLTGPPAVVARGVRGNDTVRVVVLAVDGWGDPPVASGTPLDGVAVAATAAVGVHEVAPVSKPAVVVELTSVAVAGAASAVDAGVMTVAEAIDVAVSVVVGLTAVVSSHSGAPNKASMARPRALNGEAQVGYP